MLTNVPMGQLSVMSMPTLIILWGPTHPCPIQHISETEAQVFVSFMPVIFAMIA